MYKIKYNSNYFFICIFVFTFILPYKLGNAIAQTQQISSEKKALTSQLHQEVNEKIDGLEKKLKANEIMTQVNTNTISNYISIVYYFSTSLLGVIALVFAFGAIKLYLDQRQIKKSFNELLSNISKKFAERAESDYERILKKCEAELQNHMYFLTLKLLLNNDIDSSIKQTLDAQCIYPLLTPLTSNPHELYRPLFDQIIQLNINPEITAKANDGLKKLNNKAI